MYDVRMANTNSALFNHIRIENHPISWDDSSKLIKSKDITERLIFETVCIKLFENFKQNEGSYEINSIMFHLLKYSVNYNCTANG